MAKPQPRRVPSDDCVVTIDSQDYALHEGEWVEIMPLQSVAEIEARNAMSQLQVKIEAARADPDASEDEVRESNRQLLELLDENFDVLREAVADRLIDWNWTDARGRALPAPSADVLKRLTSGELFYLLNVSEGESPAERKNGSRPMPTASSATKQPRRRE